MTNLSGKATIVGVHRVPKKPRVPKVAKRTCIDCVFWEIDFGHPPWSEVTPGDDWSSWCRKNHWWRDARETSQEDFRKALRTAIKCPDFVAREAPP